MALRKDITARILDLLRQNPRGLSITEIVRNSEINRNTAGRYLDNLLVSGQVEMRHFGMAKIYSFSRRLPVSSVLSLSSEFVMQVDTGLRVVFLNKPFALLLGTDEKEITGKNIEFSRIPPFFDETYPALLTSIREGLTGTESHGEMDLPSSGRSFSYRVVPIVFTHGQKGVSVIFDDITDRRRNDALLKESEEKFRALFNNANDMILLHRLTGDMVHGHYIEVNDAVCRNLRYSREELLAMAPRDLVAQDALASVSGKGKKLLDEGHATFETVLLTKDRQRIPVEINAHLFDFKGQPVALAIIRDITERKQIEAALRESEGRYRSLAEASQDLIFVIDREDRVQYVNRQAADFLRMQADFIIGKPRTRFFPPDVSARQYEDLQKIFATGQPIRNESPMTTATGEILWFDHALVPILDPAGHVTSVLGVSRDITRRVAAEREQRQNEERNRFIAEHSLDIIHRLDPDCILLYTSPSVRTLLGYEPEEVLGKPVLTMIHPEDLPGVMRDIRAIHASEQQTITSTFRFRHKQGHYILFESTTRILRDGSGRITEFLNISRDISKRQQ